MVGRRWIAAAAACAVLVVAPPGNARPNQAMLPTPTLSSTDLHVGDVIAVSGVGCLDPKTASGDGLTVTVALVIDARGPVTLNTLDIPVSADGAYAADWAIRQPLPDRSTSSVFVDVACYRGDGTMIARTAVDATANAVRLADLAGSAGSIVTMPYPCLADGEFVVAGIDVTAGAGYSTMQPRADDRLAHGQVLHLQLPADLAVGTHQADVECKTGADGGGWTSFFVMALIVTPPGSAPSQPNTAAPAAVPQPGTAAYTG